MHTKTASLAAAIALIASGCGSTTSSTTATTASTATTNTSKTTTASGVNPNAKEKSPSGDIPDSTAFVPFKVASGGFSVRVPEGWSRTGNGKRFTFTSNLNSVAVESHPAQGTLTVATVKAKDVPALAAALPQFKLQSVQNVHRSGQHAVRISYQALGSSNAVTGKAVTDTVERYLFVHNGTEAVVTLAAPKGADNVDAWRTMSNSVRWTQ